MTFSEAAARLASVSDTPRLDAELLLAHALGTTRERLLLAGMPAETPPAFDALVERRAAGEPLAYIVGTRDFWTVSIAVGPGVLIPRADSETLLDVAVAHFGEGSPDRVLDLGTGPGTLLLAALDQYGEAMGLGVDASATALDYARRNAAALDMAKRATFRRGDWAEGVEGRFDLVLSNPPYIAEGHPDLAADVAAHEPREALIAGADGLDDYRRIIPALPGLLAPGGLAVVEIGYDMAGAVGALFADAGLAPRLHRDLGGRDRAYSVTASSQ